MRCVWSDQAPIRTNWNQRLKRDLTVFYGSSGIFVDHRLIWGRWKCHEMTGNAFIVEIWLKGFKAGDVTSLQIFCWANKHDHFWWCVWYFPLEALWCTKRCSKPAYFNNAWNLILQRCWRQNLDAARVYESQAKLDRTHTDISVLQLMIAVAASIHFSNFNFDTLSLLCFHGKIHGPPLVLWSLALFPSQRFFGGRSSEPFRPSFHDAASAGGDTPRYPTTSGSF